MTRLGLGIWCERIVALCLIVYTAPSQLQFIVTNEAYLEFWTKRIHQFLDLCLLHQTRNDGIKKWDELPPLAAPLPIGL